MGYVCQQVGGVWKCGCRDTTCGTAYWQLQAVMGAAATRAGEAGVVRRATDKAGLPMQGVYEVAWLEMNWKPRLDKIAVGGSKVVVNYDLPGTPDVDRIKLKEYADYAHQKGLKIVWVMKDKEWWNGTYSTNKKLALVNLGIPTFLWVLTH